jgi:hypothetical protein
VTYPSYPVDNSSTAAPTVEEGDAGSVNGVVEAVRAEVASLADLGQRPLAEHSERFQQVHGELQRALAEIDTTEPAAS